MNGPADGAPPAASDPAPAAASSRLPRWAAMAVAAAFAALALAYTAAVPPFEGADESAHYFFAKHLRCTGALPVQQARAEDRGLWEQEGSQPPLYYALASAPVSLEWTHYEPFEHPQRAISCGPSWDHLTYNHQNSMGRPSVRGNENRFVQEAFGSRWNGYAAAVRAIRKLSTLLALVTLAALWSIFARVFATRPWLAVAALALVALNPQFIHLSSTVSNDNAMNAVAAVSLALLLRVVAATDDGRAAPPRSAARRRDAIALAVAVGLAPLAKLSGLALAAFVVGALLWTAWRRRAAGAGDDGAAAAARDDARRLLAAAAAVVVACAVVAGWWYLRNVRLYGSLTGLNLMLPQALHRDVSPARFVRGLPGELYGLWLSSWGVFGWFTILLPGWVYRLIDAAALAALAGGVAAWRRRRRPSWPARDLSLLVAWWLVAFIALLRWMLIAKGAHGRLLFPAVAAPAALLVLGWRALLPRRRIADGALALSVALAMAGLAAGALVGAIRPAYARPATIAATALPADAVPIGVVFDGTSGPVELVAVRAPDRVVEGADVDVTLYWRIGPDPGDDPVTIPMRDGYVALRWDQEVAAAADPTVMRTVASPPDLSYPGRGNAPFATLDRAAGRVVEDVRTVRAPALATRPDWDGYRPSTLARLVVDVYDMHAQASWPSAPAAAGGPDTAAVDIAIDAAAPQPRRDEARAADGGPAARFGDAIALDVRTSAGAAAPARPALPLALGAAAPTAGGTLDLVWRALRAPGEDLQLFVHVARDGAGDAAPLALDGPPSRDHRYPTSHWRPGDRVPSRVEWSWPAPLRPGDRLTIRLGLYRPIDGAPRLPAIDAAGARWPDDAVTVGVVTVR